MTRRYHSTKPNHHLHHIVPVHMGGTDDPNNLIELSVEEHAEAHRKLWEEHGRLEDKVAWQTLSGQIGKIEAWKALRKTPEVLAKLEAYYESVRGIPKSEEHKAALRKTKSRREKQKIAALNRTSEHQAKINKALVGRDPTKGSGKKESWVYEKVADTNSKTYTVVVDGQPNIVKNLAAWAREHGYNYPSLKHTLISNKPYKGILVLRGSTE